MLPEGVIFRVIIQIPTYVIHDGQTVIDAHDWKTIEGAGDTLEEAYFSALDTYNGENNDTRKD